MEVTDSDLLEQFQQSESDEAFLLLNVLEHLVPELLRTYTPAPPHGFDKALDRISKESLKQSTVVHFSCCRWCGVGD